MDTIEINQKLDKILEYQEKQAKYAKIRFWINTVIITVFIILPLILLPIVITKVFNIYAGVLNPENLQTSTDQAQGLLNLFQ
jgi:hypothetical protein